MGALLGRDGPPLRMYFAHQLRSFGHRVRHAHPGIELHYCEEGDGYFRATRFRRTMVPGRLTILFAPMLHVVYAHPDKTYCRTVVHIPEPVVQRSLQFLELADASFLPTPQYPLIQHAVAPRDAVELKRVFHQMFREAGRPEGTKVVTPGLALYLAELLYLLSKYKESPLELSAGTSPYDEYLVQRACAIVSGQPLELTVGKLAALLGVSQGHLNRIFQRVLGVSPRDYLMERRMEWAKRHLATGMAVHDVAALCRYASVSAFSRAFKKYTGLPPSVYAHGSSKR